MSIATRNSYGIDDQTLPLGSYNPLIPFQGMSQSYGPEIAQQVDQDELAYRRAQRFYDLQTQESYNAQLAQLALSSGALANTDIGELHGNFSVDNIAKWAMDHMAKIQQPKSEQQQIDDLVKDQAKRSFQEALANGYRPDKTDAFKTGGVAGWYNSLVAKDAPATDAATATGSQTATDLPGSAASVVNGGTPYDVNGRGSGYAVKPVGFTSSASDMTGIYKDLLGTYMGAYNQANQVNEQRYRDTMYGYQQRMADVMGEINQNSGQELYDVNQDFINREHTGDQQLMNSGLTNATVRQGMSTGIGRQRAQAMNRTRDSISSRRANAMADLSGAALNYMGNYRTQAPGLADISQLAIGMGAADSSKNAQAAQAAQAMVNPAMQYASGLNNMAMQGYNQRVAGNMLQSEQNRAFLEGKRWDSVTATMVAGMNNGLYNPSGNAPTATANAGSGTNGGY